MNRPRLYSAIITAVIALLLSLMLTVTKLEGTGADVAKDERPEIVMEEFIEPDYVPDPPAQRFGKPGAADNPASEVNRSEAAPTPGQDLSDAGEAGEPPTTVTSGQPSPVQEVKPDLEAEKRAREEAERENTRRKAQSNISNAFSNAKGKNNTDSKGRNPGNSGAPGGSGTSSIGTDSRVTGGWILPRYQAVHYVVDGQQRTDPTGSIVIRATLNGEGRPVKAVQTGGNPPASTTRELVQGCIDEVMKRRFTRNDNNPPEEAVAYITFVFR